MCPASRWVRRPCQPGRWPHPPGNPIPRDGFRGSGVAAVRRPSSRTREIALIPHPGSIRSVRLGDLPSVGFEKGLLQKAYFLYTAIGRGISR